MSHAQKAKAAQKKAKDKRWRADSGKRLVDKLTKGRAHGVNPELQRLFAYEIAPTVLGHDLDMSSESLSPMSSSSSAEMPKEGVRRDKGKGPARGERDSDSEDDTGDSDSETDSGVPRASARDCVEMQQVISVPPEHEKYSNPFGEPARHIVLQNDEEASIGTARDTITELGGERSQRQRRYEEEEVPEDFDDTYVNPYAEKRYHMVEPSDFVKAAVEADLDRVFAPTSDQLRSSQQAQQPQITYDVTTKDRGRGAEKTAKKRRGFVHPYDSMHFRKLDRSVADQLMKREKWFRVFYQWAAPLANSHALLPSASIALRSFLQQGLVHGGFLHSWTQFGDHTGRCVLKFNNYSKDTQMEMLSNATQESADQTAETISGYIYDYGCCVFMVRSKQILPSEEGAIASSSVTVTISDMFFGFM